MYIVICMIKNIINGFIENTDLINQLKVFMACVFLIDFVEEFEVWNETSSCLSQYGIQVYHKSKTKSQLIVKVDF